MRKTPEKSCGKCEIGNRSGGENTARPFANVFFPPENRSYER